MMRALAVDRATATSVVQTRQLLAVDFDAGALLASLLHESRTDDVIPITEGIIAATNRQGLVALLSPQPDTAHFLVIDAEQCNTFSSRPTHQALAIFQKLLRFALKIWNKQAFSPAEHIVDGTHSRKYVLFPLPLASASQFRLTIDRINQSGEANGDHLLVFREGTDEGKGADEIPSRATFGEVVRFALSQRPQIARRPPEHVREVAPLASVVLTHAERSASGIQVPFDDWKPLLSERQKAFALRPLVTCERLQGPAGTGKTLALLLKVVATLRNARDEGRSYHALFVTHSMASRRAIEERLDTLDPDDRFRHNNALTSPRSVTVTTLQEWCANLLGPSVAEVEYLDRDASEAKNTQILYVAEALDAALVAHLHTYERLMSASFAAMLRGEERWMLTEMFQHEIAVSIKGRAEESLDRYKQLPALKYGLPIVTSGDKGFAYLVYKAYQHRLEGTGQFDTDDIILTTMRQLDTPVWRRRREREGFDGIFVDETHLFNMNELSLIHFLARESTQPHIAFAIDRAQAVGDRGDTTGEFDTRLVAGAVDRVTSMNVVFRSAPAIVELAQAITASGATLFTNFDDSLSEAASGAARDEDTCTTPSFRLVESDEDLIDAAIAEASQLSRATEGGRAGVAVVVFDPTLFAHFRSVVHERRKPFEIIDRRGDMTAVGRARAMNRHILALPEYVGGLEFDAVVLVGVDDGRVPPATPSQTSEARHFAKYAAHNLLYVAVTRARCTVRILGLKQRGLSDVLGPAVASGALVAAT